MIKISALNDFTKDQNSARSKNAKGNNGLHNWLHAWLKLEGFLNPTNFMDRSKREKW